MVSRGQGLDTAPGNEGLAEAGEEGQDADQVSSRQAGPRQQDTGVSPTERRGPSHRK